MIIDHHDTIAAISTPPGVGGIAVIRISGDHAYNTCLQILDIPQLNVRFAHFAKAIDPDTNEMIDEVIATYFKAPASYTGEDTVEISCHGGYAAAPAILDLFYRLGVRPALPGEFTRRAFINGKMDLLQAEAVADLIHAVSDSGKKLATRTLSGVLSEKIGTLRSDLVDIASILELELDFSEQEITILDHQLIREKIAMSHTQISKLIQTYGEVKILREGALIPIAGRPNSGKSSLLNALLEEERAIISPIPGTTRDTIEESFVHRGIAFRLVYTAGLRATNDPVEKIGTERARKTLEQADLILLVVDASQPGDLTFEHELLKQYANTPVVVVFNKTDICSCSPMLDTPHIARISALTHDGLSRLTDLMFDLVNQHHRLEAESIVITKQRHKVALERSLSALEKAESALTDNLSNEFLSLDIRDAIDCLDDITGHTTSEDVLNNIFGQFCIGK